MKIHSKNYNIEYLRFILSFVVVIYHFIWYGPRSGEIASIVTQSPDWVVYGRFAVSAFFIISGYVISYSTQGKNWGEFLASRVSRLYPALFACATVTFITIFFLAHSDTFQSLKQLGQAWLFIPLLLGRGQIDPSYWSIVVELRFYFIVLILILTGFLGYIITIITLISVLGLVIFQLTPFPGISAFILFPHASFFALGILLHRQQMDGICWKIIILTIIHLALASYGSYVNFERVDLMDGIRSPIWIGIPISVTCYTLVLGALIIQPREHHRKLAALLGGLSYPLYLVHQLVGYLIIESLPRYIHDYGRVFFATTIVLSISLAVHIFIERRYAYPLRQWIVARLGTPAQNYT